MIRNASRLAMVVIVGLVSALFVVGSASASAASGGSPASQTVVAALNRCGSGYGLVDSENLNALGPNFGVVYLYYNSGNGNNCVFVEKLVARGTPTYVSAFLCRSSDGRCVIDAGNYRYYAGPVYLYARGQCVKWGGGVTNTDGKRDYFESGWEHCGTQRTAS